MVRNEDNTPVIIKFPFWKYTEDNKNAFYACVNLGEAATSEAIVSRSICINASLDEVIRNLQQ